MKSEKSTASLENSLQLPVAKKLFFLHFVMGKWLRLMTTFKQIPEATFLHLIAKFHNM